MIRTHVWATVKVREQRRAKATIPYDKGRNQNKTDVRTAHINGDLEEGESSSRRVATMTTMHAFLGTNHILFLHPGSRQSPSTSRTPLRANLRRHSCITPCTPASNAFPDTPARNHRTALARTTISEGKRGSSASTSRKNRTFGRGIVSTRSGCGCGRGDPDPTPAPLPTSWAGSSSVSTGKSCWSSAR